MSVRKHRVLVACNRCKARKRKCDGAIPCGNCSKARMPCEFERRFGNDEEILRLRSEVQTLAGLQQEVDRLRAALREANERRDAGIQVDQLLNVDTSLGSLTQTLKGVNSDKDQIQVHTNIHNHNNNNHNNNNHNNNHNNNKPNIPDDDNFLSESTFADILKKIIYRGSPEQEEYIGTFAVITIVKAIRNNLLGTDVQDDIPSHIILDTSFEDNYHTISPKLETSFVEKFFSLAHNRCYLVDHIWFNKVMKKPVPERTPWENFCHNMALGIGCRLTELLKVTSFPPPELYLRRALKELVNAEMNPTRQIQSCLLIAVFISRSYHLSFYVSSWELTGLAIRKLIQYGYHRKQPITLENCWQYEFRKRLFWSAYNNDKLLSLSLGRPFVYFDTFIDLPYPLSVDFASEPTQMDYALLYQMQLNQETGTDLLPQPISCFTSMITTSKIRLIESRIHLLLYSVNDSIPTGDNLATITRDLDQWLNDLPSKQEFEDVMKGKESYDFLELSYHRAKLLLLIPIIMKSSRGERQDLLEQVNASAGSICINYKNLYNASILEFSIVALHTVFLAGVTLVFCLKHKGQPESISIHQGIRACSSILYIFSERWIEARTYRDLFDTLLDQVTSLNSLPQSYTQMETNSINEDFWDQILQGLEGNHA